MAAKKKEASEQAEVVQDQEKAAQEQMEKVKVEITSLLKSTGREGLKT